MWKLLVYRDETSYLLCHRANLGAKVCVLYRTEFQRPLPGSIHKTNPNHSKRFVPVEVWDRLFAYIGRSLGNNYHLKNLPSIDSAWRQFVLQCASNFNYRVWRDFRTSQHISGLEYTIPSKCFLLFSVFFLILQHYIRPLRPIINLGHMVWSRRAQSVHQPVRISYIFKQM